MATKQYVLAPGVFVNETGTRQEVLAPGVYLNETSIATAVGNFAAFSTPQHDGGVYTVMTGI